MTRSQLSIFLAALGALAVASGCGGDDAPEYDSGIGTAQPGVGAYGDASAPTGLVPPGTTGGASDAGSGALPPNPGLPTNPGTAGGIGGLAGLLGRDGGLPAGFIGGLGGGLTGGLTAGGGATGGGGVSMLPTTGGGTEPKIPAISGECPTFMNGTIMVAGHKGVLLTVGAPNKMGALFFYWHGTGGTASQVSMVPASIRNEVISSGGIIASFNGADSSGTGGDCSGTAAHNIADFNAADQIAACAVKNHGIDPRRIYTTGCSAGGLQSGCMAQLRSSYIAASAPNSGGVVFSQKWQDAGKPAIFTMHGGTSDMVGVSFSDTSAALDKAAKDHGSFVVNCNHGGGHCGAPAALYQAAWLFMKDHPYGVDSPWKAGIPAGMGIPDYCKIY